MEMTFQGDMVSSASFTEASEDNTWGIELTYSEDYEYISPSVGFYPYYRSKDGLSALVISFEGEDMDGEISLGLATIKFDSQESEILKEVHRYECKEKRKLTILFIPKSKEISFTNKVVI